MLLARLSSLLFGVYLLAGCASEQVHGNSADHAERKGVHSGQRERIEYFYSALPTCEIEGYPEIRVVRSAHHGNVTFEKSQDYPGFSRDNVRWECNKKLLGSTRVFYESNPDFHGNDSVSIEVLFPSGGIRTVTIAITVL